MAGAAGRLGLRDEPRKHDFRNREPCRPSDVDSARTAYRLGWQTTQAPEAPHKIDPPADEPKKDADAGK